MIAEELPLDPERPIIDSHLHLWEILPAPGAMQVPQRFLLPELLAMVERSGHNITHTVFIECHAMYRKSGPPELRSIGETEFANGIAAMSASGGYGPRHVTHRIVGTADLCLGSRVTPVLEAHMAAAGTRFRGVRCATAFSKAGMFGAPCDPRAQHMMLDPQFHEGAHVLASMDLSLDIWCFHNQLDDVITLARALPELTIILNHIGTPALHGAEAGGATEVHAQWKKSMMELARHPNIFIKLGGLGMDVSSSVGAVIGSLPSKILAAKWRFHVETCIAAFTPKRCTFESNFPPDNASGSYGATWNAFKIIVHDYTEEEKDDLFRLTAANIYRISLD